MRVVMTARFDVTDLSAAERDALAGEVSAQADRSELHPSLDEPTIEIEEIEEYPE